MPEFRELLAHFFVLFYFFQHLFNKTSLVVVAIWVDLSEREAGKSREGKEGLVISLEPTNRLSRTIVRGQRDGQTHIFPQQLIPSRNNPTPAPISSLVLNDISWTGREVFLDFGTLYFKFAFLTHTSIQIYTAYQWLAIRSIPKKMRVFKVAIAFEFQNYVLAFLTQDLIIQPNWEVKPAIWKQPQICNDFCTFLIAVERWLRPLLAENCLASSKLACVTMRETQAVWCGIGVYTVSEIFCAAGVSPLLSEKEVFGNPSRTARLCEAFYNYAFESFERLPAMLNRARKGFVLAPTLEQRLEYQHWLRVYGKEVTYVPERMKTLLGEYHKRMTELGNTDEIWYRAEETQLYDVFEPSFISAAFCEPSSAKPFCLGHMIFGEKDWQHLRPSHYDDSYVANDPLTLMYKGLVLSLSSATTHLKPGHYMSLSASDDCERATKPFLFCKIKSQGLGTQLWSLTDQLPANSYGHASDRSPSQPWTGWLKLSTEETKPRLFSTIINNVKNGGGKGVAIGPLEYCGHAFIERGAGGQETVVLSREGDPLLTESQIVVLEDYRY